MAELSKRVLRIEESGIRDAFNVGLRVPNPINLSLGQPHFEPPQVAKEAAINAILHGRNGYTPVQGIQPLRERLFHKFVERGIPQEDCLITSAVSGAFLEALMTTCDDGDELIIPDPYFPMWRHLSAVLGVKAKTVDLYPDFRWDEKRLRAAITPKTKAISLSSVGNPTGVAVSEAEAQMIARVAEEHNLWILWDEIYEGIFYGEQHTDMSRFYHNTITLGGFSKTFALAGWRIGYAAGPKEAIDAMISLHQYAAICASGVFQYGALAALDVSPKADVIDLKHKRDWLVEKLHNHYEIAPCDGAFYLFMKPPGGISGTELCQRALKHGLILMPGHLFSRENSHFRLSFSNTDENLERGANVLLRLAEEALEEASQKDLIGAGA